MNNEKLKLILERLPIGILLFAFLGYLGWDYYNFTNSPDSPLLLKQAEVESTKKTNGELQVKLKAANDFFKSLDAKKSELRRLSQTLEDLKGSLSTDVDIPGFMKMTVTEAKRVGLTVRSLKPLPVVDKEFYQEQPFELSFRGVYVQLLVFLDHLSNVQNIVRVEDFDIKPVGLSGARFVELDGTVQIKTYKYIGTSADSIAKAGAAKAAAASPTPAAPPAAAGGGH